MSARLQNWGAVNSLPGQTAYATIAAPGVKSVLAIVASYMPPVGTLTYTEPAFWGRITVSAGEIDLGTVGELDLESRLPANLYPLLDFRFHVPQVSLFFPLTDLYGAPSAGLSSAVSIVLHVARDGPIGGSTLFRGFLNVAGGVNLPSSYRQ